MSSRREILIAIGAALTPVSVFSQSNKIWHLGILSSNSPAAAREAGRYGAFVAGMRELGYIEGRNVVYEWRYSDDVYGRLPALASELVRLNVDVIVTNGTPAVRAARQATETIPIVAAAFDPVVSGLVASLARPGGNVTGMSSMGVDLYAKRMEFLALGAPKVGRIAVMVNPRNDLTPKQLAPIEAAAGKLKKQIVPINADTLDGIVKAFIKIARDRLGALLVVDDSFFNAHVRQIVKLAAQQKLPSMFSYHRHAEAGGLMSYGINGSELFRRAATYVDKIFKGAKPGDLPIEQPTKLELVVNMKTAKALGMKMPNSVLVQATKVIE